VDNDGWKWCVGSIEGFGDCAFEILDDVLKTFSSSPPERVGIRRLTLMRPNRGEKGLELQMMSYFFFPFGILEPDDEIAVPAHKITFIAAATTEAQKRLNKVWDPSGNPDVVPATKQDLANMEQQRKPPLRLIT